TIDVTVDEDIAVLHLVAQFAGMMCPTACSDEMEGLIAGDIGLGVDDAQVDLVRLCMAEVEDHVATGKWHSAFGSRVKEESVGVEATGELVRPNAAYQL